MSNETPNPLEVSDEDFLNMAEPAANPIVVDQVEDAPAPVEEQTGGQAAVVEPEAGAEAQAEGTEPKPNEAVVEEEAEQTPAPAASEADPAKPAADANASAEPAKAPEAGAEAKPNTDQAATENKSAEVEVTPEAAVSFYKEVMKPFKANGKDIELRDPKEAIALMQMGANYTKKLQELRPHRKFIMMLDNNGLLDEDKLSYLIDLDKKNPEAIRKLLKDSGVDPLEIDTTGELNYRPGDHSVTDAEADFRSVVGELVSNPQGQETVTTINNTWDDTSKELLWKSPEVMSIIHEQRQSGVYDLIAAEVDRRTTLGMIKAGTPFIESYKAVGDEMVAAATQSGSTGNGQQGQAPVQQQPTVIASRAAKVEDTVDNGEQASAASPTRASPKAAEVLKNPLAMSDEEFLKLGNAVS